MTYKLKKRSKKLDKNELLHRKSSRKLDARILKRKQFENSISDKEVFNLKGGMPVWSEFVVNIPGRGKVAKAIAHSKILKVRTDDAENKFNSMMKKYNELKLYLIQDLNPIINKLLKYIFTKKNEGLSFNKKSMVSTHKKIYQARNKLYQRLFGIKQKKTANNFLRSVEKTIELRKIDNATINEYMVTDSLDNKTNSILFKKKNGRDLSKDEFNTIKKFKKVKIENKIYDIDDFNFNFKSPCEVIISKEIKVSDGTIIVFLDDDVAEDSVSKQRDTENAQMNVRDMAGFFSRSRNVLALRCPKVLGGKRIECLVKQFRKKEKSYNNALVKFELAKDKFHNFIDPFVDRAGDQSIMEALEDSGRQINLQDEYVPQDFKDKREQITEIFNDAVNNIYSRVTELNKKMKQFFDEDFPTVGILRYNFTGVKYKRSWSSFFGLPGTTMRRNKQDGENSGGQTKVELDSRAQGNLKMNRNNFMKIFVKLNDIYTFLNDDKFCKTGLMTLTGEKVYQLIYGRFNDIDKLLAKIVGLNTDNIRRICRKDLGALTSSDNYIRGMDNILLDKNKKQEQLDVDVDTKKTALAETGDEKDTTQEGGKQSKANLRKQGIYRQYKLPVFIENRFLSSVLKKEDIKNKNLSVRKFTYTQLGLYKPSKEEIPKLQDKIIVPYSFYSAAIYEPHIFSADDVLFGTLAFILGRENEIIGAETAPSDLSDPTNPVNKIRHNSLINSIDKLRIELGVKDKPKFSSKSSKRENRQKMSIVRYYSLFFSSVIEYYVYFLKMQIDKFVICNLLNYCLQLDTIPNNNNNNENTPDGKNSAQPPAENIGLGNLDNLEGGGNAQYIEFLDKLKTSDPEYILNPISGVAPGATGVALTQETDLNKIIDKSTQVIEKGDKFEEILINFEPKIQFKPWGAAASASASASAPEPDETIYNKLKQQSFKFQDNLPLQPNAIIKSDLNIYLQNRFFTGETRLIDILDTIAGNTRVFVPGATGDFRFSDVESQSEKQILEKTRETEAQTGGTTTPGGTTTAAAATTTTATTASSLKIKNQPMGNIIPSTTSSTTSSTIPSSDNGKRFYQTFADDTKIASNKFANILPKVFFREDASNNKIFNEKILDGKGNYTNFVTNYNSQDLVEFKKLLEERIKGQKKMTKLGYNFDLENVFYANLETEFFKLMPLLNLSRENVIGVSLESMIEKEVIEEAIERFKLNEEFKEFKKKETAENEKIDKIKQKIKTADQNYKNLLRYHIDKHNKQVLEFYENQFDNFRQELNAIFKNDPNIRNIAMKKEKEKDFKNIWKTLVKSHDALWFMVRNITLGLPWMFALEKLGRTAAKSAGFIENDRVKWFRNLAEKRQISIIESAQQNLLRNIYINYENDNIEELSDFKFDWYVFHQPFVNNFMLRKKKEELKKRKEEAEKQLFGAEDPEIKKLIENGTLDLNNFDYKDVFEKKIENLSTDIKSLDIDELKLMNNFSKYYTDKGINKLFFEKLKKFIEANKPRPKLGVQITTADSNIIRLTSEVSTKKNEITKKKKK